MSTAKMIACAWIAVCSVSESKAQEPSRSSRVTICAEARSQPEAVMAELATGDRAELATFYQGVGIVNTFAAGVDATSEASCLPVTEAELIAEDVSATIPRASCIEEEEEPLLARHLLVARWSRPANMTFGEALIASQDGVALGHVIASTDEYVFIAASGAPSEREYRAQRARGLFRKSDAADAVGSGRGTDGRVVRFVRTSSLLLERHTPTAERSPSSPVTVQIAEPLRPVSVTCAR